MGRMGEGIRIDLSIYVFTVTHLYDKDIPQLIIHCINNSVQPLKERLGLSARSSKAAISSISSARL